jgi:hypothetical protein
VELPLKPRTPNVLFAPIVCTRLALQKKVLKLHKEASAKTGTLLLLLTINVAVMPHGRVITKIVEATRNKVAIKGVAVAIKTVPNKVAIKGAVEAIKTVHNKADTKGAVEAIKTVRNKAAIKGVAEATKTVRNKADTKGVAEAIKTVRKVVVMVVHKVVDTATVLRVGASIVAAVAGVLLLVVCL